MEQLVRVPDPHIVHRNEAAGVIALALGHHGAGTHDERALDKRQHAEAVSAETMIECLINYRLLVALLDCSATGFVAECRGKVHDDVVVELLRKLDRSRWILG